MSLRIVNAWTCRESESSPAVRYSVYNGVPTRLELGSQSGLQAIFGIMSYHPVLEYQSQLERAQAEAERRRTGKDPSDERLKDSRRYMAQWMLVYPLAVGIALLIAVFSGPTKRACLNVAGLMGIAGLLLFIQFGVVGSPAMALGLILMSLQVEVHYTIWFVFAVLGLVVAGVTQAVWIGITTR
jgi:hypothetical protein